MYPLTYSTLIRFEVDGVVSIVRAGTLPAEIAATIARVGWYSDATRHAQLVDAMTMEGEAQRKEIANTAGYIGMSVSRQLAVFSRRGRFA